ncbi:YraN family protein [Prosthecochloris sp. GSB1]|uniref:YraN family protein n=1 Tax=Prosthecochloris sp. GSB1 TaxID=281093 RepID=UPI000B8CFC12|nr:YraN family protein [Prosthecochloris sp. GSB1]ASQ89550.1 YraN family protein [Prosthecochloris sp. GSB1]
MTPDPHDLGRMGELAALSHLVEKGYRILERNYRFRRNEIDIIAMQNRTLCFIEVKTRTSCAMGHPLEAVTPAKQKELVRAATAYLASRKEPEPDCRFDVIGIVARKLNNDRLVDYCIDHVTDAFPATP